MIPHNAIETHILFLVNPRCTIHETLEFLLPTSEVLMHLFLFNFAHWSKMSYEVAFRKQYTFLEVLTFKLRSKLIFKEAPELNLRMYC